MKFEVKSVSITQTAAPCVIVPIFDGGKLSSAAEAIDQACQGALRALVKRGDIEGKTGQWTWLPYLPDSKLKAQRVLLAGVGKKAPMKSSEFVSLLQKIGTQLRQYPVAQAALFLDELDVQDRDKHWQGQMIARALRLSLYRFEQMKSKKSPRKTELKHIIIDAADRRHQNALRSGASQGLALAEGMIYAKDLGNLPGNVCTPVYLAGKARELARHHALLEGLFASVPDVVVYKDREGCVLGGNPAFEALAGRPVAELVGLRCRDVFKDEWADRVRAAEEAVLNSMFTAPTVNGRDGNVSESAHSPTVLDLLA